VDGEERKPPTPSEEDGGKGVQIPALPTYLCAALQNPQARTRKTETKSGARLLPFSFSIGKIAQVDEMSDPRSAAGEGQVS
jgi:hypothetical protein